jgi:hypothetical protein
MRNTKRCAVCQAEKARERHPLLAHDVGAYAKMLLRAHHPQARCSVLGVSLATLELVGERLSVDRIDPALGYVRRNMRLLTLTLNSERKGDRPPPQRTINELLWRLNRVSEDGWHKAKAA